MQEGIRDALVKMKKLIDETLEADQEPGPENTVFFFCTHRPSGNEGHTYSAGWGNAEEIAEQMLAWIFDREIELQAAPRELEGGDDPTKVIQGPWTETKQ